MIKINVNGGFSASKTFGAGIYPGLAGVDDVTDTLTPMHAPTTPVG